MDAASYNDSHISGNSYLEKTTGQKQIFQAPLNILKEHTNFKGKKIDVVKSAAVFYVSALISYVSVPIFASMAFTFGAYNSLRVVQREKLSKDSLIVEKHEMKQNLYQESTNTLKVIARHSLINEFSSSSASPSEIFVAFPLNDKEISTNKQTRKVLNALKMQGIEITEKIKSQSLETLLENYRDTFGEAAYAHLTEDSSFHSFPPITSSQVDVFNDRLTSFQERLLKLEKFNEKDYKKALGELRALLQDPVYQAIKEDSSQRSVQFLHLTSASLWNNVKAMDGFQAFGNASLGKDCFEDVAEFTHLGQTTVNALEKSLDNVEKEFHTDVGLAKKVVFASTHPKQSLGSMAAEGGFLRTLASYFGQGHYDNFKDTLNIPSLQGFTTAKAAGYPDEMRIDNVYGGTPTIGDDAIDPIFLATIQGAENNQLGPPEFRQKEIPDKVFYTNYQNIAKSDGEGPRSITIMKLNSLFPCAFVGITLTKDTDFYMHNSNMKEWPGAEAFGDIFYEKLMDERSFSLENRTEKNKSSEDPSFYFPGEPEKWSSLFKEIIKAANEQFANENPQTKEEVMALSGAYQEFVYQSIQYQLEFTFASELQESGIVAPRLHSQRACKENYDRGGSANMSYLYLRLPIPDPEAPDHDQLIKERIGLVAGALHCRPLACRGRMVMRARLPQNFALISHVEPSDFIAMQKKILEQREIQFDEAPVFSAALKEE